MGKLGRLWTIIPRLYPSRLDELTLERIGLETVERSTSASPQVVGFDHVPLQLDAVLLVRSSGCLGAAREPPQRRLLTSPPADQDDQNGRHNPGEDDGLPEAQMGRDVDKLFEHVSPSTCATRAGAQWIQRVVRIAAAMHPDPP